MLGGGPWMTPGGGPGGGAGGGGVATRDGAESGVPHTWQ
jgi:hypothetical protein